MKTLKDGMVITVNGTTGDIIRSGIDIQSKPISNKPQERIATATKVYVILRTQSAPAVAKMHVDGGLFVRNFDGTNWHASTKIIEDKKNRCL